MAVLRAAGFMQNFAWTLRAVLEQGVLPTMYLPVDRPMPMVSTDDIGAEAARLMQEEGSGRRVIELHGPQDYSPADAAAIFGALPDKPVRVVGVPEDRHEAVFLDQGRPPVAARAMADIYRGFNSGLIAFEGAHDTRRGPTELRTVLDAILRRGPVAH